MAEKNRSGKDLPTTFLGARAGARMDRIEKVAAVALAAVDAAGGVFAWQNPEAGPIVVGQVILDVTNPSSAACSVSVGTAANGTTSSANLLDTQSVAAIGQLDNTSNKGTNGKSSGKVAAGAYVTGSKASGATAGLAGTAYISYMLG